MLTRRATQILNSMVEAETRDDHENAEIVCEGITCWLGEDRLSRRTVTVLIRHVAVRLASEPGSLERYVINETGRNILKDPTVADDVLASLLVGAGHFDSSGRPLPDPMD
jgi:hypothetical protein